MNKMNNKGFLLAESLIVATFVLTALIYLFSLFKISVIEYKKSYSYNTVEDIYNLGSIAKYIKNNNIELRKGIIYQNVDTSEITDSDFFSEMAKKANIDYLIYEDSNIEIIKNNMSSYEQDLQDFIEKIKTNNIKGKGRLIAKFNNGHFATILIDKAPIEEQ